MQEAIKSARFKYFPDAVKIRINQNDAVLKALVLHAQRGNFSREV
jgi:hypothetical protein